jgi:hypothetical protein
MDLLRCRALVEADEPMEEVVVCGIVIGSSLAVREIVIEGRAREFLSEEIDLILEKQVLRRTGLYAQGDRERHGRTIDILTNHHELLIESKRVRASWMRF